ncbi:hypothetical protein ACHAO4_000927 [Trichoderma viride]
MSEMSDASNDKIVVVPQRSNLPSPPPTPLAPPSPPPDSDPAPEPTPAVAAASRPSRGLAAGDDAFPSVLADDENELLPSYEISTLPRPSDAHVHITVRSNTSASSLPSLAAAGSINTQGYVLTAPMSHQTASSRHSASHSHHNDQDPITFYGVEDPWVRRMYNEWQSAAAA